MRLKEFRALILCVCLTLTASSAVAADYDQSFGKKLLEGFVEMMGVLEGERELVLILPDYARPSGKGRLTTTLHGWVFEKEQDSTKRSLIKRAIASQLGLKEGTQDYKNFERRMTWFLVDNESDQEVRVTVGDRVLPMPPSDDDGHFQRDVVLDVRAVDAEKDGRWVPVRSKLDSFNGASRLPVANDGPVAIISDIDDTVKDSNVLDRKELLLNSLVRPFRPVQGMAKRYQAWEKRGAQFHYLSASPWNLYTELAVFLEDFGFPTGALYLRTFRLTPSNLYEFGTGSQEHKLSTIRRLLHQYPNKRFVLVGDAGEHDPEIYGTVAAEHPHRIEKIYIRAVDGADNSSERMRRAVGAFERWELIPSQL